MATQPTDPRWSEVLSLTAHELRTPLSVVAGYIRMLLTERAGPLPPPHRKLLEECEKSAGRLTALLAELSALSDLEDGTATFNRNRVDLRTVLTQAVDSLPELPDRHVGVDLETDGAEVTLQGDPVRLRNALASLIAAVRREIVKTDRVVVRQGITHVEGDQVAWIAIAAADRIDELASLDRNGLLTFDEWRGGVGLSLPIARRVIQAHGGSIWTRLVEEQVQEEGKEEPRYEMRPLRAGALLSLPVAG